MLNKMSALCIEPEKEKAGLFNFENWMEVKRDIFSRVTLFIYLHGAKSDYFIINC